MRLALRFPLFFFMIFRRCECTLHFDIRFRGIESTFRARVFMPKNSFFFFCQELFLLNLWMLFFFWRYRLENAICGLRWSVTQIPEGTPVAAEPTLVYARKSNANSGFRCKNLFFYAIKCNGHILECCLVQCIVFISILVIHRRRSSTQTTHRVEARRG